MADAKSAEAMASPQPGTAQVRLSPSLKEVRSIAAVGAYRRIPVRRELLADQFTTIEVMRRLRAASHHVFMLESAEPDQRSGRWSFLGFAPTLEVTCLDGTLRIRRGVESVLGDADESTPAFEERKVDHPGPYLRELIAANRSPQLPGFPPFTGGLVGYFSYDYLKYAEPILRRTDLGHADFLDVDLMLFNDVIAFDSYRQRVVLVTGVDTTGDIAAAYGDAARRLDRIEEIIRDGERHVFPPLQLEDRLAPRFSQDEYCRMVETAKDHIREGDIFQVVLSDPLTARAEGSLFDAYRLLRTENPSPYMFYFTSDDVELAGASPETLARLTDGRLFTYPLAGTRPRGKTPKEDAELERGLLADEKELAEHNMLVDLGRNDLGRVAAVGSVHVDEYLQILRFSHVMHIGSTVSSTIAPGKDAIDAVDAILPAGTLSGAPKLRACQIIQELEGAKRGIYGGAIGYLDFSGNLDTCIGIRLAYKKNGEVCVQSGAGIVIDSVPEREYQECQNKARAVVAALEASEGGIDR